MIDLHCHTTASDGTLTPHELVELAAARGFTHLAITDHDSVAGTKAAAPLCRTAGILLIPAVELSTEYEGQPVDILGYGIDPDAPVLGSALRAMVTARAERLPRMIERLRGAGIDITREEVERFAEGGVVGRPHLARALVERGVVANVSEAFERYIGRGRVGYEPKEVLTPEQAIAVVKDAGGIAVLAHPCYLKLDDAEFDRMLDRLTAAGLAGIEVYYSQHTPDHVQRFEACARERRLLATGGSDFHGASKPHIALGDGPGGRPLPAELAAALLDALRRAGEGR